MNLSNYTKELRNVKLSDLGQVITGTTPSTKNKEYYNSKDFMFIKPDDLEENKLNYISISNSYISILGAQKSRRVPKGTILVTCIGTIGKVAYIENEACFNQQINAIIPDLSIIDSKFLGYAMLKYNYLLKAIANAPIVPIINKTQFSNIEIMIPPLEIQKKIVQIFEKSEEILQKRKEVINLLDELVKSRFIEMFGSKKYPEVKTQDVCEYITKGTTPKTNAIVTEYSLGFVPYLKVYNLSFDGSMLFEEKPQYVSDETHNKVLARSKVFPNDVLMNIVGPPLGKFAIVPNTYEEWNINQAIAIFRATKRISPAYLLYALKQPNVLRPFIDSAVGIRQQNLSLLQCRSLEIPLPPIELQNQFADFVKQVDKLKFEMQKSLKEMENNFNSLMQRAFKGDLFN